MVTTNNLILKISIGLSIFYFFYFASVGAFIIYTPNMLKAYNYSTLEIGILFSITPLIRFISPFFFIKILKLDFFIIKVSIAINLIAVILFFYFIENFYYLLAVVFLYGISFNQFLPYIELLAMKYLSKSKYGSIRMYGSIGFIAVALIAPYFNAYTLTPLYLILISSVIMCASIILINSNTKKDISKKSILQNNKFSLMTIWPFWVAICLIQISFGGMYNFFTIYILEHHISIDTASYLWTFGVICEIIMLYYQKNILNRYSLLGMMKFSILTTCIRWIIVFLYPDNSYALFISQSLHAFSFALFHSACIFYLAKIYKNQELAQLFYLGVSFGLGGFIGASFAGAMYGEWLFLYEGLIALAAFIFLLRL